MHRLIDNIVDYFSFLEKTFELSLSVHFSVSIIQHLPEELISRIQPYGTHTNPYCAAVKKQKWEQCICSQKNILQDYLSDRSFCRTCYAGVKEYISRSYVKDEIVAYIAVSGYRDRVPAPSCISNELWTNCLSENEIPTELLDTVIPPLCRMFELLLHHPMPNPPQDEYNLILQYLHERHGQVSLDALCSQFGRSRSYISHMFNEKCNMSLPAYCNSLKLEYAKILLSKLDIPITEVALDVGYNDVSYFILRFKEKFGMTPLQYRKLAASHTV